MLTSSIVEIQNSRLQMSLSVLRSKVATILQHLQQIHQDGASDPKFLRLVHKLCSLLSNPQSSDIKTQDDILECLAMVYTSLTMKNIAALNELTDKYMATFARRGTQF